MLKGFACPINWTGMDELQVCVGDKGVLGGLVVYIVGGFLQAQFVGCYVIFLQCHVM